jgi:S-adenosylmethionine synthetase
LHTSQVLKKIGYNGKFCILKKISKQSPDIALEVNESGDHEQGAGDQGMMYGYACTETPQLMPLPIVLAHEILRKVDEIRKEKYSIILEPDGKCQFL